MSEPTGDNSMKVVSDVLGTKPVAAAVEKGMDGLIAFLGRICNPAAEELGLMVGDLFKHYRKRNLARLVQNTKRITDKLKAKKPDHEPQAHPRVVYEVIEKGSLCDDEYLQELWGGLLAASCGPEGGDDGDLIYINLLSQFTSVSARILRHTCETTMAAINHVYYPYRYPIVVDLDEMRRVVQVDDRDRITREIEHLYALGLLHEPRIMRDAWHSPPTWSADLTATPLGHYLYIRCQGSSDRPEDYWAARHQAGGAKA